MKPVRYVAVLVVLVITLITIPSPTYAQPSQGDVACPQQNDPLCALAQRFRPFLRFAIDSFEGGSPVAEPYAPTSWQWFLANSDVQGFEWCKGHPDGCFVTDYGKEPLATLMNWTEGDMRGYTYDPYSNLNVLNAQQYLWLWLVPWPETGEDWTAQYAGDYNAVSGDGIYAHVEPINDDLVNIEYWMLYAYNAGLNNGVCKEIARIGKEVYNHHGDLDFGYSLVYSKSAEAAGIGHDGIIRVTITEHGKIIFVYDLTSSSSKQTGTWDSSDFDDLTGGAPYYYTSFYQIANSYEDTYCPEWGGCLGCLDWLHKPCDWGGSPPNGGGAQVTFVADPVSGFYDHLAVWPEWGSHEFWPGSCGDNTCLPKHTGNGPAYLPTQVTYLGTLSYLINAPDYQENYPFAFYNGRWGTDPDPAMLHNEWYFPLQRGIDPCGQENPWNIGNPVQTGPKPTDITSRGFDDSGDGWSNPYCVQGCYYTWGCGGEAPCNCVKGGLAPSSMPWPPVGDTSWANFYWQPQTMARPFGPTYRNSAGTFYVAGKTTFSFYVAQDLTFADNSNYGVGPTTARTYYEVYPAGTTVTWTWPPTPPPPPPQNPPATYPATPPPPFKLATAPFPLSGPDGAYDIYYYSVDVVDREATLDLSQFTLDTTPPVITIIQPTATTYPHSATLTLNYNANDGTGSGVASVTPTMDGQTTVGGQGLASGQAISLLTEMTLGSHTFTVGAVDNVGNQSTPVSVTFTIIVTPQSIMGDVTEFESMGWITPSEAAVLLNILNFAAQGWASGSCTFADFYYYSFISQVSAQSGLTINPTAAAIMIGDANYLIANCP